MEWRQSWWAMQGRYAFLTASWAQAAERSGRLTVASVRLGSLGYFSVFFILLQVKGDVRVELMSAVGGWRVAPGEKERKRPSGSLMKGLSSSGGSLRSALFYICMYAPNKSRPGNTIT